jgi:hypothetical protein
LLAEPAQRILACAAAPPKVESGEQPLVNQAHEDVEPDGLVADVEIGEPPGNVSEKTIGRSSGPNENFIEASSPSDRKFHGYLIR